MQLARALFLAANLGAAAPQALPPVPRPVQPNPQALQPNIGTLVIDAMPLPEDHGRSHGIEAAWIFVNGQLQGKAPMSRRLSVSPGVYDVRVVIGGSYNQNAIYWTLQWPRIVVTQGQSVVIKTAAAVRAALGNRPLLNGINVSSDDGVAITVSADREPTTFLTVDEAMVDFFVNRAEKEMDETWASYLADGDVAAVLAVDQQLRHQRPSRPVVWLNVDSRMGGPREFDVEQLQFLRRALKPDVRGWIGRILQYPASLSAQHREFFNQAIAALQTRGRAYRKQLDDAFDRIIARLEAAREQRERQP